MIVSLHLVNFTIIESLSLDFQPGMTALTGETGAGKSIIIDAIQLALGMRLENKVVRENTNKASISLSIDIQQLPQAQAWLKEHELHQGDDCILRRIIHHEGRSKAFINDHPVNLQTLQQLGQLLINIHGQHQHQQLSNKNAQLKLVDQYGGHEDLAFSVKQKAIEYQQLQQHIQALQQQNHDQTSRLAFLRYQLHEFAELALAEDELTELDQEHKQLAHGEQLLQQCQQAMLYLQDQEPNVSSLLQQSLASLEPLQTLSPHLQTCCEQLHQCLVNADEAYGELKTLLQTVDLNPERLAYIEERLAVIHDLARKHQVKTQELPEVEQQLLTELDNLEHRDHNLAQLESQLSAVHADYLQLAKQLSSQRQQTATQLSQLITDDIQNLNMKGGKFEIELSALDTEHPQQQGLETIQFLVAANVGQKPQPLAKVASGGELSRISLAIQVNIAQKLKTPALIFDEVDTGIGGATADIVGNLLRRLGEHAQVFCITHLPQVAAKAHHHLKVSKQTKNHATFTKVTPLNGEEKIKEIARMLGGQAITENSLRHAEEMLVS